MKGTNKRRVLQTPASQPSAAAEVSSMLPTAAAGARGAVHPYTDIPSSGFVVAASPPAGWESGVMLQEPTCSSGLADLPVGLMPVGLTCADGSNKPDFAACGGPGGPAAVQGAATSAAFGCCPCDAPFDTREAAAGGLMASVTGLADRSKSCVGVGVELLAGRGLLTCSGTEAVGWLTSGPPSGLSDCACANAVRLGRGRLLQATPPSRPELHHAGNARAASKAVARDAQVLCFSPAATAQ